MSDLSPFQGRWKVTAIVVGGRDLPEEMFAAAEIRVAGDRFESIGNGAVHAGRMEVHPDGATYTLYFDEGRSGGRRNNVRYAASGDMFQLCIDLNGGPAPGDMRSTAENGYVLETVRRIE